SRARSHSRAGRRAAGGAPNRDGPVAGGRGSGPVHRSADHGARAPVDGLLRRPGRAGVMPALSDVLHLDVLLQLGLAVLLGGAIGLERELAGKPAGLRTNILICVGAMLFTLMSVQLAADGPGKGDPTRIAAQIATGVGVIGAGTILHTRGAVTGLTSA